MHLLIKILSNDKLMIFNIMVVFLIITPFYGSGNSPMVNEAPPDQTLVYIIIVIGVLTGLGFAIWFLKFRKRKHTDDSDIIDVR